MRFLELCTHWYSFFYRGLMRVAHHFNWHWAPVIGPFEDSSTQRWCQWCGFRESYRKHQGTPLKEPPK